MPLPILGLIAGGIITAITATQVLVGIGAIIAGLAITGAVLEKIEAAQTRGFRDGYSNASKEYEIKLMQQYQIFEEQINNYKKQNKLSNAEKEQLVEKIGELLGNFQGFIKRMEEEGRFSGGMKSYEQEVQKWIDVIKKQKK